MAIYHRDEYASPADWALDVMCEQIPSNQLKLIESFLYGQFEEGDLLVCMLCFLDLPNVKEKFEQFLIKEAEYHG